MMEITDKFGRFVDEVSGVTLYNVSGGGAPVIHRFYDTSPISPSGNYIALTELPFDDKLPSPGEEARVFVIALASGDQVYSTKTAAWDTQVGAHVQWGRADDELYFNRMDKQTWEPYGVKVDIFDDHEMRLGHTIYMVSPDGRQAVSPCLKRIGRVQPGYGVIVPDEHVAANVGSSEEDGIYLIDTHTGKSLLIATFKKIAEETGLSGRHLGEDGAFYGFHVKWAPTGNRIMFIIRFLKEGAKVGRTENYLITMDRDGSNIKLSLDAAQWEGGHHPNWYPDGRRIVMNLIYPRPPKWITFASKAAYKLSRASGVRWYPRARRLSFACIDTEQRTIEKIAPSHVGSGHPTVDPSETLIVTDAYPYEEVTLADGRVPIRAIFLRSNREVRLFSLDTKPRFSGPNNEYRIDPHPAWDRSGRYLVVNAAVHGCRTVYIADMSKVLDREHR